MLRAEPAAAVRHTRFGCKAYMAVPGAAPLGLQHTQNDFLIDRKKVIFTFFEDLHTTQAGSQLLTQYFSSAIDEFWGFS